MRLDPRRLIAALLISCLFGIIIFAYIKSSLSQYNVESICASVPTPTISALSKQGTVNIISPSNGSDVDAVDILPITIKVNNFDLNADSNRLAVWIDGKVIEPHKGSDLITLWPQDFENVHLEPNGTHNICLALIDGKTGAENGNPAGIRIGVRWRGPDEVDFSWLIPWCIFAPFVALGILLIVFVRVSGKNKAI